MAKFTLLPKSFHLSKRGLLFLVVALAILLNVVFTCAVVYLHNREFLGQAILSHSQNALDFLSRDTTEGNYRRAMEQLSSKKVLEGAQTQSILFYETVDKRVITSNNDTEVLRCRESADAPYFENFQGNYLVCIPVNSRILTQIVFKSNWIQFLKSPQFVTILVFNLIFAGALTLLTLLGMNLYLDRFILLLNRLLKGGILDKNIPREFHASFDSIKQLSSGLEYLKAKISKNTQETILSELSHKVLHNIKSPLGVINTTLPLLKEGGDEEESVIKKAVEDIEVSVGKALESYKENQTLAPRNLYQIVEQACADARIQCADKEKIKILPVKACEFSRSYTKKVDLVDFKAAITNILSNSIEATSSENGNIQIEMSKEGEAVKICITDEGTGIAEDILPYVGERGFSGKKFGNGLGIYSLKKDIQFWGGTFKIGNRRDRQGAEVIIIL